MQGSQFYIPHKFTQLDLSSSLSFTHDTLDEWIELHVFTLTTHLQATEIKDFNQYWLNGFEDNKEEGVQLNNCKWMGRNTYTLVSEHVPDAFTYYNETKPYI